MNHTANELSPKEFNRLVKSLIAQKSPEVTDEGIYQLFRSLDRYGWTIRTTIGSYKIPRSSDMDSSFMISRMFEGSPAKPLIEWFTTSLSVKEPHWLRLKPIVDGNQDLINLVLDRLKGITDTRPYPTLLKKGDVAIQNVKYPLYHGSRPDPYVGIGEVFIGTDAFEITSPQGATYLHVTPVRKTGRSPVYKPVKLWKWLFTETTFIDTLSGYSTNVQSPNQKMRTMDNTGTCGICEKNIKLEGGRLVDHGFKVPKNSYGRSGRCFGAGKEPWEVSPESVIKYLEGLDNQKQNVERKLQTYEASDYQGDVPVPVQRYDLGIVTYESVSFDNPKWKASRQKLVHSLKYDISSIDEAIVMYRRKLASWSSKPLPGNR